MTDDEPVENTAGAPRQWLLVSLLPPAGADPLLVVDALRRAGSRAVDREGMRLVAHLPEPADREAALRRVEAALRIVAPGWDPAFRIWTESQEQWARRWARLEEIREIGERFAVLASGSRREIPAGRLPIFMHTGLAFGAGDHPTTRACLRLLEPRVRAGDRVLDVGAGTAILAIAAVHLGAASALALEADPLACADAHRNVAANRLQGRVAIECGRVGPGDLRLHGGFDGVVANVEHAVLSPLLRDLRAALKPAGWVVVSGAVGDERHALVAAAVTEGLRLRGEVVEEGWWAGWLG